MSEKITSINEKTILLNQGLFRLPRAQLALASEFITFHDNDMRRNSFSSFLPSLSEKGDLHVLDAEQERCLEYSLRWGSSGWHLAGWQDPFTRLGRSSLLHVWESWSTISTCEILEGSRSYDVTNVKVAAQFCAQS